MIAFLASLLLIRRLLPEDIYGQRHIITAATII